MIPEDAESAVDKLLEQEPEELEKPFPHRTVPTSDRLSAHGTSMQTQGKAWMIKVFATQHPFPAELFTELDLHNKAGGESGFLGWIGGAYTDGNRYDRSAMVPFVSQEKTPTQDGVDPPPGTKVPIFRLGATFVEEVQSDVLQRTIAFTTKEKRQATMKRRIADISTQYGPLYQEYEKTQTMLAKLELSAKAPQSGELLQQRLAAEEKLDVLLGQLKALTTDMDKAKTLYPQYAEIRSKVENAFKKWIPAFFNAALRFAQSKESTFFGVITSDKIRKIWQSNLAGRSDTHLFDRIYDGTAARWGMIRRTQGGQDWWIGLVADMRPLESVEQVVTGLLGDAIEPAEQWKQHLETFFRVFMRHEGIDLEDLEIGSFQRREAVGHVFRMWLDEVQDELKQDPEWRDAVNALIGEQYGADISDIWSTEEFGTDDDEDDSWAISDEEIDSLFYGD